MSELVTIIKEEEQQDTETLLGTVFTAWREQAREVKQHNHRAGEDVFPVLTQQELLSIFLKNLNGAGNLQDFLSNNPLESLYPEPLDPILVKKVYEENPETINILGKDWDISYHSPKWIEVSLGHLKPEEWKNISDDEFILPSGRLVTVVLIVKEREYTFSQDTEAKATSGKALKNVACGVFNEEAFKAWEKDGEKTVPEKLDFSSDTECPQAPTILIEHQFGICQVTGLPLMAYGYYWAFGGFKLSWSMDRDFCLRMIPEQKDVQKHWEKVVAERKAVHDKAEAERLWNESQELWENFKRLYREDVQTSTRKLSEDLCESVIEAYEKGRDLRLNSPEKVSTCVKKIQDLYDQCQTALNLAEKAREEKAKKLESGEIIEDFSVYFRRGGMDNNGYGCVINENGERIEPDFNDCRRRSSDGCYTWSLVDSNWLALEWSCSSKRDIQGNSTFTVAKMPFSGELTKAQLEEVFRFEEELGLLKNSFGLDPELKKEEELFLSKATDIATPLFSCYPSLSYHKLIGEIGVEFYERHISVDLDFEGVEVECDNTNGTQVWYETFEQGVLEIVFYEKYGGDNFTFRYRKLSAEELQTLKEREEEFEVDFVHIGGRDFRCSSCSGTNTLAKEDFKEYESGTLDVEISCNHCKGYADFRPVEEEEEEIEEDLPTLQHKGGKDFFCSECKNYSRVPKDTRRNFLADKEQEKTYTAKCECCSVEAKLVPLQN